MAAGNLGNEAARDGATGIYVAGGQVEIDGFHVEGVATGIWIATPANYPGGAGMTRLRAAWPVSAT